MTKRKAAKRGQRNRSGQKAPSPSRSPTPRQRPRPSGAFLLLGLIEVGLVVLCIWDIRASIDLKSTLKTTQARQQIQFSQAEEMDAELQSISVDLLDLAKSDPQAKSIAERYHLYPK